MVWHCTGEDIALMEFMEYHGGMQWRLSEMVWTASGGFCIDGVYGIL